MIIAMAGQKGGPGKTTTTINLASHWVSRGLEVLVLDADPQRSALDWHTAAQARDDEAERAYPTVVYVEGDLKKTCARFEPRYDHILIDLPGRDARVQREALLAADLAVLPVVAGAFDLWSLRQTLEYVGEARELRKQIAEHTGVERELAAAFLRSRFPVGQTIGREVSSLLAGAGVDLLDVVIHTRKEFARAPSLGLGVTAHAPKSKAAREVRQLARELEERYAPSEDTSRGAAE